MPRHEADTGDSPRNGAVEHEMAALEGAVRRLIVKVGDERRRTEEAEGRARHCETLLGEFSQGSRDPAALVRRVTELEGENGDLRARLEQSRTRVEEILARIRFLEDLR